MSKGYKFFWKGAEVARAVRAQAVRGLSDGADYLLDEANKDVPHDEGILQASGTVDVDDKRLEASVSYDTPYARRLHEHPEYRFHKGRSGKWLENALNNNSSKIRDWIAKSIERALK